jgi:predicted component of type VI protein secretion system
MMAAMSRGPALAMGQLTFPLNRLSNTVGRRDRITNQVPEVDLAALDQERGVSRKHAELSWTGGGMSLRDVGSTNGTTVNGEALPLQVDRPLADGDRISFGGLELVYVADSEWPEGVTAEWPEPEPEPAAAAEAAGVYAPEQTMIQPPAQETVIFAPPPEAPVDSQVAPEAPVEIEAVPLAPEATPWEPPSVRISEAPRPEPVVAPAGAEVAIPWTPCSNHPHLPAIGLCPGCLEPFCQDCLPDRGEAPMACNRCYGIQQRLGGAVR